MAIADPAIGQLVYKAMQESGEGLIQKFGFDPAAHHAYIDRITSHSVYCSTATSRGFSKEALGTMRSTAQSAKPTYSLA